MMDDVIARATEAAWQKSGMTLNRSGAEAFASVLLDDIEQDRAMFISERGIWSATAYAKRIGLRYTASPAQEGSPAADTAPGASTPPGGGTSP